MKLLLPTTLSTFAAAALASPSVTIDAGTLVGGKCNGGSNAVYYKGIPFAEPPVGELRFEPPQPYGKKYPNGQLDATTGAPTCIQFGSLMVPPTTKSEDCLYLDVWTPADATSDSKLPVKVFVYGGSDKSGGIEYPLYDGCNMAEDRAILVSVNYRLGPLGFMALDSAGIYGNQGIQDVLLALEWVQQSISAFGGDPKKVVLFGQSAGATDVYTIATLPQAPSLFQSAISESIALPQLISNATLQMTGASFAQTLQCSVNDKSCLQSKTPAELQSAFSSDSFLHTGLGHDAPIGLPNRRTSDTWPYVDGTVISENPATRGPQVPMIFGFTQNEGMMDALTNFDDISTIATLKQSDYTTFLRGNFGPLASLVEKYYPLSLFKAAIEASGSATIAKYSTGFAVLEAMATIVTDNEFKCPTYQMASLAARNGIPAYMYEFTHNSTCVWLDTMPQSAIEIFGAAHTAELPYVFGNLEFNFANQNTTCTGSKEEWNLSKQMMSLWTAMAEKGVPSTGDIEWPAFKVGKGPSTPGMVFGDESTPGTIDFSACQLWAKVSAILDGGNATATGMPSSSGTAAPSASATPSSTGAPIYTGGAVVTRSSGALAVLLAAVAAFVSL